MTSYAQHKFNTTMTTRKESNRLYANVITQNLSLVLLSQKMMCTQLLVFEQATRQLGLAESELFD